MEVGSKLLEHTLIMGGDNISSYSVWQGWPASFLYNLPPPAEEFNDEIEIVVDGDTEMADWSSHKIPAPEFSIGDEDDDKEDIIQESSKPAKTRGGYTSL